MKLGRLLLLAALAAGLCACASGRDARWVAEGFDTACRGDTAFAEAAGTNTASLDALDWSPFGAAETGWRVYAPKVAREIGSPCAPESAAFAARLARWQGRHGLAAHGAMTPEVFEAMKAGWQGARPFVAARAKGICPDAPPEAVLAAAAPGETYMGKTVLLRPEALTALRRMREAARPALAKAGEPLEALALFSGFRSPAYDDERCRTEQNCQGVVRAQCSAHRTGTALDLMVGAAPGYTVDASAGPNRLFQAQTPAYRWLVANARRFGFVNYVFEPWHWEWAGDGGKGLVAAAP